MKTKILAVSTFLLAVLCIWEWRALDAARQQLSETTRVARVESQGRAAQEHKAAALEQEQSRLASESADLSRLVTAFRAADAKYATNYGGHAKPDAPQSAADGVLSGPEKEGGFFGKRMGGMLSKMMKDPAMKDFMRVQQKTVVTSLYGSLGKDLNLSPEQNSKMMDLLLDQQMNTLDHAQSMLGNSGETPGTNLVAAIGEDQKQAEKGIRALLGEEKFGQYQEYQKTIGDRAQLNLFKQQLDGGQSPLQDEQVKQLLGVFKEEREKNPPAFSPDLKPDPADLDSVFSGELMEQQMQWQEQVNQRLLERAGQILTPDQLKAYGDFQNQQLSMQKVGLTMARELFGAKDRPPAATAPPPPPEK